MQKGDSVAFHGEHGERLTGRIVKEQPGCGCGYWVIESGGKWYSRAKTSVAPSIGVLPTKANNCSRLDALQELVAACDKLPASDARIVGLLPIIQRAKDSLYA